MHRSLATMNRSIWKMKQIPQFAIGQYRNYVIMDDDDEMEAFQRNKPIRSENSFQNHGRSFGHGKSSEFHSPRSSHKRKTKPVSSEKTSENSWLDDIPLEPIDWNALGLPELNKNLYKSVATYSDTDIADFRTRNHFQNCPPFRTPPIFQFDDIENLPKSIKSVLKAGGYTKCTPIQAESIPIALSGENITVGASIGYVFKTSHGFFCYVRFCLNIE